MGTADVQLATMAGCHSTLRLAVAQQDGCAACLMLGRVGHVVQAAKEPVSSCTHQRAPD